MSFGITLFLDIEAYSVVNKLNLFRSCATIFKLQFTLTKLFLYLQRIYQLLFIIKLKLNEH